MEWWGNVREESDLLLELAAYLLRQEIREVDFEATHPTAHPLSFSNALV